MSVESAHSEVLESVRAAVAAVPDPEIGISLGELGMVRSVALAGGAVRVRLALTVPGCPMKDRIGRDIAAALVGVDGVDRVEVDFQAMDAAERGAIAERLRRPGDGERFFADGRTTVIAIASGKGGVGKSTLTVNLACALAAAGKRVGVIDADVWGFSVPRMLGLTGAPTGFGGMLFPLQAHGVKAVSVGLFADEQTPIVWRGPMLHTAVRQFLADVHWGELDVLLLDLPPGTGDVPISLASMLPTARVVVVTTPQEAARTVAERAGRMAANAQLRVCGVIENMGSFACPCCGEETAIFGDGGGEALARSLGVPLVARIPVALALRAAGDRGEPLVVADPGDPASVAVTRAARRLLVLARPPRRIALAGLESNRAPAGAGAHAQGRS